MVETSPLMIIQFGTIAFSIYCCSKSFEINENVINKTNFSNYSTTPKIYRKKSKLEIILRIIFSLFIMMLVIFGFYKWIFFMFPEIDDSFALFLAIVNFIFYGAIAYVIIDFIYYGITDLIKEFREAL